MALSPEAGIALFKLLSSQAPNIVRYVQGVGGHISQFPNILNAIDNGYDIPLMDENIADIGRWEFDDGGNPKYQQMVGGDVLNFANNKDYNTNITPYDPNGLPDSGFESANSNTNEFTNLFSKLKTAEEQQAIGGPSAMLSAATFENNPDPMGPYPTGDPTYASHLGELLHDTDGSQDEDARKAYLEWLKTHGYR